MPAEEAVQPQQLASSRHRLTLPVQATAQPPTGRRHPYTHVRRRVFGQVPSSCCSPPPPVKAGRAPSRALIRRAQRDRRVPRQLVGAQPRHKDTARRRSPGQREHNEACALPSYSLPYKCCSGNRPAGSWAVLLASRLHTHQRRGTTRHAQRAQRAQPE